MAEAVFKHMVEQNGVQDRFDVIDSFGTGAYHTGESPDRRSAGECKKHGIKVSHRAQRIEEEHFDKFDYLLAMDESNYEDLMDMKPDNSRAQVALFGDFRQNKSLPRVVSDPYYGGVKGFETNYKQLVHFSESFLDSVLN